MAYETETLNLCHELTPTGEAVWRKQLEIMADEILWKHEHPVQNCLKTIKILFKREQ